MVNTLSHLGIGLLIALALGFKGKKRGTLAFLSIFPDLDFIPYILFALASDSVSHETRNQLFYLLGHREFMHSILFILLVTLFIWIKTKDRRFTAAGFAAIFSHSYLDYATSWKMRPLYPFSTESSIMGAVYFFDPLANLLPLLPLFIVLIGYAKSKGKWNGKFNNFCTFVTNNRRSLYRTLAVVLVVWLTVLPVAKFFLVNHISEAEGTKISYQGTYPVSFGKFLAAYPYNDTHYKIMEVSYLSGIERSDYIEKVNSTGGAPDASAYAERAGELYSTAVPQEIDYPVYSVSEDNGSVTVLLSDARNSYVERWAYFRTVYRFVFDKESGEYKAYASEQEGRERKLEENYFG
ncbi:metal-dependent hydrolase [Methanosarcina sp. DH2]|uniref:metal-dependent hydrolase n=1 Tax=Methanosarcina sp. DH2 TaxID=2605639 RepID=UPI001E557A73|nr:metal-dependent hydrolase [Methanosarcina sp. DH2]MCC4771369.1 metal-dependent hydrolase [Methanosarcina sp. DH2]